MIAVVFQTVTANYWFLRLQFATEICFTAKQVYNRKYFAASIRFSTSLLRYAVSSQECFNMLIDPSEIAKEELSKYEDSTAYYAGEEYLYFKRNGPQEKFLILCADADDTGAFNPRRISSLILNLSKRFDVKFRTIYKIEDIQKEIHFAALRGRVMGVLLQAHGGSSGIHLSDVPSSGWLHSGNISPSLFSGLDPNCVIVLDSCSTAQYPDTSLAYRVAKLAQRITFAADGITDDFSLENVSPLEWSFKNEKKPVGTQKIVPEPFVI